MPRRVGASSSKSSDSSSHSTRSIPGASTARSMSERSKWSPRAREPNSHTRWTAGRRARRAASSRISSRRGKSGGRVGRIGTSSVSPQAAMLPSCQTWGRSVDPIPADTRAGSGAHRLQRPPRRTALPEAFHVCVSCRDGAPVTRGRRRAVRNAQGCPFLPRFSCPRMTSWSGGGGKREAARSAGRGVAGGRRVFTQGRGDSRR